MAPRSPPSGVVLNHRLCSWKFLQGPGKGGGRKRRKDRGEKEGREKRREGEKGGEGKKGEREEGRTRRLYHQRMLQL